jgi:hypothetical protein
MASKGYRHVRLISGQLRQLVGPQTPRLCSGRRIQTFPSHNWLKGSKSIISIQISGLRGRERLDTLLWEGTWNRYRNREDQWLF